ncbi:UNVERIFIED_CONTAM: Autophagy-related protein 2 [Sesamum calycinum]|uniref:Autophagy-related protein 2 n=1 Tax=Sesamum calycinum TaxID=2727403 RepID=A0AAW2PKT2_9LAMI
MSGTLEFLKEIEKSIEVTHMESGFGLESEIKKYGFAPMGDQGKDIQSPKPIPVAKSEKSHTMTTSCSLKFNFGDVYLFLINSVFRRRFRKSINRQEASFTVEKIISAVNKTGHQSLVSLIWQESPVTGPWIVKKAKILASSENGRREDDKVVWRGCEFASVTTVKESKDFGARTRQEILARLLHGLLPPVTINLSKSQFENICGLLNQMVENFSCIISESVTFCNANINSDGM